MNDLADGDLASQRFREHEGVEGQQQAIVLGELIGEDETDGDELGGLSTACRWHALNGMETGNERRQRGWRPFQLSRGTGNDEGIVRRRHAARTHMLKHARYERHTKFHAHGQSPLGSLQILRYRSYLAFVCGHVCYHPFGGISAIGLVLRFYALCIRVG